MNNSPVAWMMKAREPSLHSPDYITFETPTRDMKVSHHPYALYTHPVKEQSNLIKVVQNHVKDLKRCVKVFRTKRLNNTANEMEDAIKELEDALEANTHPVKELTDEEIYNLIIDVAEKPTDEDLYDFAKAILRKARE